MKKKILAGIAIAVLAQSVIASEYNMRLPVKGVTKDTGDTSPVEPPKPPEPEWVDAEPIIGEWYVSKAKYDCSAFSPSPEGIFVGTSYLQTQNCKEDKRRDITSREYNAELDTYRGTGVTYEDSIGHQIMESQQAYGFYSTLSGGIPTKNFYSNNLSCSEWDQLSPGSKSFYIEKGSVIYPGTSFRTCDNYIVAMQSDGHLVIYDNASTPLWWSNTANLPVSRLEMQSDGNLVIYSHSHEVLWSTGTQGSNTQLRIGPGGQLKVYNGGSVIWSAR